MKHALTALALVLTLAACGGESEAGGGYEDTKALADALGCGASHEIDTGMLSVGAKETASCNQYSLAVFASNSNRDAFVEAVGAFGGAFAVGEKWAVGARTIDGAKRVAEALDGEVV